MKPGEAGSMRIDDRPEPLVGKDEMLVAGLLVGVCGTDHEIRSGTYGQPPRGRDRLVLGHESLGRVLDAPPNSSFTAGDLVVGIVRRPDPDPCPACAIGEWDMCRDGRFTEHGIKERDGFAAERFNLGIDAAVRVPSSLGHRAVLVEPASVVAKAWKHIQAIGSRAAWYPKRVLITGAGPVGLLAALFATRYGLDVHVLDLVASGPKPSLVRALGATYHVGSVAEACDGADIVVECTGAEGLVFEVLSCTAPAGIVCLTGVSSPGRHLSVDAGRISRDIVLQNDVVFGSVNANAGHYRGAVDILADSDPSWLDQLVTRRVAFSEWPAAFQRQDDDIKVVIDLER